MLKGSIQKMMMEKLEKEGKIENVGKTYRSFASSPRMINNTQIKSFIEYAIGLGYKFTLGARGGLDTSVLSR